MQSALKYLLFFSLISMITGCSAILDLTKNEPLDVNPQQRTFGAWVDDISIKTTVSHNVEKSHPDLDRSHIDVNSFNGVVLLTGEIPNAEVRAIASEQAQRVPGVRIVHNELAIRDNTSFFSRLGDGFLHKRIKLKLRGLSELRGINIDVIVEDNVAYLMGIVTRQQGDVAAERASLTSGLRQVVKVFEYVDEQQ